ncbi:FAD/NAD(P)-binding domain-containing protein [Lophiostoma macrostomum CBS 122681]|uniref:FAD/NAD(P)-binding domain-containing protein n=1 Tax=Lophiostoma macrostomum CBS 122681 TaxID=1314788 RepID=A0A6A6TAA5_9PLEO|nr:FAD/NAD(P)-binding domain-containing protein [Lophiostoma macrostomum CBS 122681]
MSQLRVLVVGASIAGPMTAYWLAKTGAQITVIERFPALRTNGQQVDIRTAGVTVMGKIAGMEAAVRSKTTTMEGMTLVRSDGRPYGTLKPTGDPNQQALISEYEILRGDLAAILYDLTKDNERIKYVFGEQVASIQQHEKENEPVTVEFANGYPKSEYDLVVACDGAASRTRAIGFGCGVRDHIHATNIWHAYFSTRRDMLEGRKNGEGFAAPEGRVFFVGPDPEPNVNRVGFMCAHKKNDQAGMQEFRDALKQGDALLKNYIAKRYAGVGWKSDEVIEEMMDSKDFYGSEIMQVKVPTLHKGRFVLVGDAGYSPGPTGGGTTLAIAGAYFLAGEILRNKDNIEAGLQAYEKQMKPLTDDLQKIPPGVPGVFCPQTAWGLWLRNNIFAFLCWSGIIDFAQRFFGNAFASAEKYKLPEYEWIH